MPKRASSTEGLDTPAASEKAVEEQETIQAPVVQTEPETPLAPAAAQPAPQDISLPNANILHSQVYMGETQNRLSGFQRGLTLLQTEMANMEAKYMADMADLQKRVDDLKLAVDMATAPISVYEGAHAK